MPKAYAVITYQSISDSEKHTAYSKLAVPAVTPFGARILAFDNAVVALEYARAHSRRRISQCGGSCRGL